MRNSIGNSNFSHEIVLLLVEIILPYGLVLVWYVYDGGVLDCVDRMITNDGHRELFCYENHVISVKELNEPL
jgi:hypothetical protein